MKELIDTLRSQHEEISRRIDAVNDSLRRGDGSEVRRELESLATSLVAHLATEDAYLYPALSRAAESTGFAVPAKVAATYAHNMQTISVALKAFLEAYSGPFELDAFRRDWILVSQLLTDRIDSEESTLYPLYTSWRAHGRHDD